MRLYKVDTSDNLTTISIHALHTECDFDQRILMLSGIYFNSRTPYRVRLVIFYFSNCNIVKFQFTHSIQSATANSTCKRRQGVISIHALHTECDKASWILCDNFYIFQFTHSIQSATFIWLAQHVKEKNFNSRTPYRVRPSLAPALYV